MARTTRRRNDRRRSYVRGAGHCRGSAARQRSLTLSQSARVPSTSGLMLFDGRVE